MKGLDAAVISFDFVFMDAFRCNWRLRAKVGRLLLSHFVLGNLLAQNDPLYNGHDLSGWVPVNGAHDTFRAEGESIVVSGTPKAFLRTEKQYQNFVLELEWRFSAAGGNSGVLIWADGLPAVGASYPRSIEVQLLDPGYNPPNAVQGAAWFTAHGDIFPIQGAEMTAVPPKANKGTRSFPTKETTRPAPAWNRYRIVAINGELRLSVNGEEVTIARDCNPRKGYICLESEGAEVKFRNIRIKELPGDALPSDQLAMNADGFSSLLNARDFTGWTLPGDAPKVWRVEGNLVSAENVPTTRGIEPNLWTVNSYRDFILCVDWRLTRTPALKKRPVFTDDGLYARTSGGEIMRREIMDAGDSGIYLRGSPRYQVNIWCQPMGSGDINEVHKDVNVASDIRRALLPRVKADAPLGEWNRFMITLKGDRLTVLLNGMVVLEDALLPGIAPEGPIALQHEYGGAPIEFTNVFIKELN